MTNTPKIKELWTRDSVARLFNTSDLGFFIVGANSAILDANATFCKLMGYSRQEMLQKTVMDFTHPDDLDMTRDSFRNLMGRPGTHVFEKRYVTRDGSIIWVKLRTAEANKEDDETPFRIGMVENITAEKQNELVLKQMAAIVEQSDDAIFRTNIDGLIEFWSPGAEKMYGYRAEEVLRKRPNFLPANLQDPAIVNAPSRLIGGEVVTDPMGLTKHKDGHLINVSVQLFPLANADGDCVAFIGVHRDLRELKQLEEQLRHSQRMETAGLLAGGIAHDFNNILTVIQGACDALVQQMHPSAPGARFLELIDRSADKASRLTRQLLAFSRKQQITPQIVNPGELLQEFTPMLLRTLSEQVQLTTRFQSRGLIREDPTQLEQVVLNLCVNARYAMPKGGHIIVETLDMDVVGESFLARPGYTSYRPLPVKRMPYVVVSVTDTGTGISQEHLSHIFEPFYTTRPKGEGTGLGLAVVYGVVAQAGGAINVLTCPGMGTVFQILLPRVHGVAVQTDSSQQEVTNPSQGRILIIEDDADVRMLIVDMLRVNGFTVSEAASPVEILRSGQPLDVDLILSDVVMPEMNGPEFARIWQEKYPESRFLFMSGYFDESRYPDQFSKGNLLLKPFKPAELISRIHQKLEG